jgi:hypothetical protein
VRGTEHLAGMIELVPERVLELMAGKGIHGELARV